MAVEHDNGGRDSAGLAREAERARADVERTLEAIQESLSPGQLMDQAVGYFRDGSAGQFGRNLGRSVRENPVPVALIGMGLAWLMASGRGKDAIAGITSAVGRRGHGRADEPVSSYTTSGYGSSRHGTSHYGDEYDAEPYPDPAIHGAAGEAPMGTAHSSSTGRGDGGAALDQAALDQAARDQAARDQAKGRASAAKDAAGARAASAGRTAKSAAAGAAATAREQTERARSAIGSAADDAWHAMRDARENASHALHGAGDRLSRVQAQSRERFRETLEDQPLVLGAISFALGAAIAAALPTTRRENELLGPTRDRLKDQAAALGRAQIDKAGEVAGAAYEAGREQAGHLKDDVGKATDTARDTAQTLADDTTAVATAAASAAREEAGRQGLGQSSGQSSGVAAGKSGGQRT